MTDNVIRMYGNLRTGSTPEAVARDGECADTAKRLLNKENRDD
jgi:conjugal transfer pilus assembly protein TrbC